MKKELKEQIKQDELIAGLEQAAAWASAHRDELRIGAASPSSWLAAVGAVGYFQGQRAREADRALRDALTTFEAPVASELPPGARAAGGPGVRDRGGEVQDGGGRVRGRRAALRLVEGRACARSTTRALSRIELGQYAEAEKALKELQAQGAGLEPELARLGPRRRLPAQRAGRQGGRGVPRARHEPGGERAARLRAAERRADARGREALGRRRARPTGRSPRSSRRASTRPRRARAPSTSQSAVQRLTAAHERKRTAWVLAAGVAAVALGAAAVGAVALARPRRRRPLERLVASGGRTSRSTLAGEVPEEPAAGPRRRSSSRARPRSAASSRRSTAPARDPARARACVLRVGLGRRGLGARRRSCATRSCASGAAGKPSWAHLESRGQPRVLPRHRLLQDRRRADRDARRLGPRGRGHLLPAARSTSSASRRSSRGSASTRTRRTSSPRRGFTEPHREQMEALVDEPLRAST